MNETFSKRYIATLGVDVQPIQFPIEKVTFNVWDTAGQENFKGLGKGYYKDSHACIVMYDASDIATLAISAAFIQDFRDMCPEAPIFFVGNKIDIGTFEIPKSSLSCSSKDKESCTKIMHYILCELKHSQDLRCNL
tara:strand:+ start:3254 stop:3661 length:408 start_codon:yes stop_codon:yes gene_type:complete